MADMVHETRNDTAQVTARDGRTRGRDLLLSQDAIVECALELGEREGPAALSLRRLGRELGVDATAFYRYFRGKDDLILACMNRIAMISYADVGPRAHTLSWQDLLRAVADKTWDVARAHPAIVSLAFARTTGGEGEQQIVELLLSRLSELGLDRATTVLCYRTYADTVLALCGANATVARLGPEIAAKDATAWVRIYAVLPEATYPSARAHAAELSAATDRAIFDNVIEAVIGSIERRLPDPPSA